MAEKIVEVNAPAEGLQPDDRAAATAREAAFVQNRLARETGEAIGGAVSRVGGQIGERIDRHIDQQQISHGSVASSELWANLTHNWTDTASKAPLNDTSIGQGFKEQQLEPSLTKFREQFDGSSERVQQWADETVAQMRQHFTRTITADESIRAGAAVGANLKDTHNNLSVIVGNNPAALGDAIQATERNVEAMIDSHNLTAEQAAKVRSELPEMKSKLADAAFIGMVRKNPAEAELAATRGEFSKYWDTPHQDQMFRYAEHAAKLQEADDRRAKQEADVAMRQASADHAEEIRQGMYDANSGRVLPVSPRLNQQILADPKLLPKDKTALILWNQTQYQAQRREDKALAEGSAVKDNQAVLDSLRKRVGDSENPTTRQEVIDALSGEQLTRKSAGDLMWRVGQSDAAWQAVQRPFKEQWENVKHVFINSPLSPGKVMTPDQQLTRLNQAESDAQKILRDAYQKKEDMRPYLDPTSPKWALREAMSAMIGPQKKTGEVAQQASAVRAAAAPTADKLEQYVEHQTRGGGYTISVPNRSPLRDLQGKSYASKDEAVQAMRDKLGLGPDVRDLRGEMPPDAGKRQDGSSKGPGFLGPLKIPGSNAIASEYTVGVQINGKETDIPTLVPTLTRGEVQQVLAAAGRNEMPPEAIIQKAKAFAEERLKQGKSVFAEPGESPAAAAPVVREFKSEAEAAKAGLAKGTRVKIDGKLGTWQ